ncbi:epoxide hydrolase family protein [Mesorhizobium sp. ANAO-SY3R2]|uniref:epoxide hydrolase family protein n=1 Tax=Mesorhizobium sp. ANAO-SY3R2 TaxID=3166644 RepID=UPI00366DB248
MTSQSAIEPFRVDVDEAVLKDLRARLANTRWPDQLPDAGWEYGTESGYLRELCEYWRSEFDWRKAEARLNAFPQYMTEIDGQRLHFYHIRSPEPDATPLLISHGWPGSVAEFLDVLGPLSDPRSHGGNPKDAFHVIAPSLPGYGFSGPTQRKGFGPQEMAATFAKLMERLEYERYAAQGGDWGAVITTFLGSQAADKLIGIHLNLMMGTLMTSPPDPTDIMKGLTPAEQDDVSASLRFRTSESGYQAIQASKPQTAAYGLNDSPAGLAGWIVEKFRTWSDCEGDVERSYTKDQLLTNITIYWVTQTINSSMRLYYEFTGFGRPVRPLGPDGTPAPVVHVPTAHARYPKEVVRPPRSWTTRQYPNMIRWTEMPQGGHFAAMEHPGPFVEDVRSFFRELKGTR